MFFFGDASATAEMMIQDCAKIAGPGWPEKDRQFWSTRDLQSCLIYCSSTLRRAVADGQEESLLQAICDVYEKYLAEFSAHDDVIHRAITMNLHDFPWKDPGAVGRQTAIARDAQTKEKPLE